MTISDDKFADNNENDPPYPTYRFDWFLTEQWRRLMLEDHSNDSLLGSSNLNWNWVINSFNCPLVESPREVHDMSIATK